MKPIGTELKEFNDLCQFYKQASQERFLTNSLLKQGYSSELLNDVTYFRDNKKKLYSEIKTLNTISYESYTCAMEGIMSSIKDKFKNIYNRLFNASEKTDEEVKKTQENVSKLEDIDDSDIDYDKPVKKRLSWKRIVAIVLGVVALTGLVFLAVKCLGKPNDFDGIKKKLSDTSEKMYGKGALNFDNKGKPSIDNGAINSNLSKEAEKNKGKTLKELGYKQGFIKQIVSKLKSKITSLTGIPKIIFNFVKNLVKSKAKGVVMGGVSSMAMKKLGNNNNESTLSFSEVCSSLADVDDDGLCSRLVDAGIKSLEDSDQVTDYNKLVKAVALSDVSASAKAKGISKIIKIMKSKDMKTVDAEKVGNKLQNMALNESSESYRDRIIDKSFVSFEEMELKNNVTDTKNGELPIPTRYPMTPMAIIKQVVKVFLISVTINTIVLLITVALRKIFNNSND